MPIPGYLHGDDPANPCVEPGRDPAGKDATWHTGLRIRDELAARVLAGFVAGHSHYATSTVLADLAGQLASDAVKLADALIAELNRTAKA